MLLIADRSSCVLLRALPAVLAALSRIAFQSRTAFTEPLHTDAGTARISAPSCSKSCAFSSATDGRVERMSLNGFA